jgi:hypothetical protein
MGVVLELYEILFASVVQINMIVSRFFRFFTTHDTVRVGPASRGRTPRSGSDAHVALLWPPSTLAGDGALDLVDLVDLMGQAVPPINRLLGSFA